MKNSLLSPLEIYINKVFKLIMIAIPSIAICAGATLSALKLLGYYTDVPLYLFLSFDISCVSYFIIGWYFSKKCEDENGLVRPEIIKKGKSFFLVLYLVQWNFITYLIPSRDFWAYSIFFILLSLVFLDTDFVLFISIEIIVSIVVSWLVIPDKLLPVRDELFVPEMALRVVLLILGPMTVWQLANMIKKRLANELEKIADFDTLTLLYNRRRLETYLDSALKHNKTSGMPFSAVMIDLDDFKLINDTHGHSCGDEVLRDVARIISNVTGTNGVAFRYGGEEMLVLLYVAEDEAYSIADTIRKEIEGHRVSYEDKTVTITVTLGVAACSAGDSAESLIKRADSNLYYGKTHGKNCVIR